MSALDKIPFASEWCEISSGCVAFYFLSALETKFLPRYLFSNLLFVLI